MKTVYDIHYQTSSGLLEEGVVAENFEKAFNHANLKAAYTPDIECISAIISRGTIEVIDS